MEDFNKLPIQARKDLPVLLTEMVKENDFRGTLLEPFANKDNFWNLIFAIGMILGSLTIGLVFSLIIMVVVLKRFSKVTFTNGKVFNSQNKELSLKKQLPTAVFVILTTVATIVFISMNCREFLNSLPDNLSAAIIIFCLFIIPTLFFMLNNCPISVLFNRMFWSYIATNAPRAVRSANRNIINYSQPNSNFRNKYDDYRYNPTYSSYSNNIYHRKK